MSFTIKIQRMSSESIKVKKTVSDIVELTGVLREGSSIIDPVVLIEDTIGLNSLSVANYMTIPEFGRKYFIGDIRSYRDGLVEISGHVDVLSSFSGNILQNTGIIYRQEEDWNLYLNDGVLEIYQDPVVVTKNFPTGFDGQSYVLALAGRRGYVSTTNPYSGVGIVTGGGLSNPSGTGDGSKTCAGLAAYAAAHINDPYWWGTFGNVASQALLNAKFTQCGEAAWKSHSGGSSRDYTLDFGKQVFDCVGLIKGYRWSDSATSAPVYPSDASQDVDVRGLYSQCFGMVGIVGEEPWNLVYGSYPGVVLFWTDMSHCGVSLGDGTAIECTTWSGNCKVIRTNIADRSWGYWGIPAWMVDYTGTPVL